MMRSEDLDPVRLSPATREMVQPFPLPADYLDSHRIPMEVYQVPTHEKKLASEYSCEDTWKNDAGE